MSLSINRVVIAGNLTRDPELKFVGANQTAVCSFGVAVNRKFKDAAGELKEEVTFVDVDTWTKIAEHVGKYFKKGQPIYLEGRLKLEGWETADGQKRQRLKVIAETVQFVGPPRDGARAATAATDSAPTTRPGTAGDDEPPF